MTGGRLCGRVRYDVPGPLAPVVACRCAQCRCTSGRHGAVTTAPREALEVTGEATWFASSDATRRGLCGTCGSSPFWEAGGARTSIMAATPGASTGREMSGHAHVAGRSDYRRIAVGLPSSTSGRTEGTG